jgi:TRAP-type C4-dicarboxylate transport system substrate-binding protein
MLKHILIIFSLLLISNFPAQALTIKIATLSPDGSVWMETMRAGAKEIKQKTEGRVIFKFYPGGVMGDDKNVLRKIRFKQLQGAAVSNAGLTGIYPDIQLYNLVLKFKSLEQVDFVRQHMDKQLMAGLENKGFVSFGFAEMGLAYIMSTSAVKSIADLRGQKVWAPSNNNIAIQAFKACSVSPIPLALRDVLMGLQTGMINTIAGTPTGALALQWHTKIKYVTDLPLSYIFGVFIIDQKAFKKISDVDQKIVRAVMEQVALKIDRQSRQDNINAIKALQSQGIEILQVDEVSALELKNVMEVENKKIIEKSGLSTELVKQLDGYLKQYDAQPLSVAQ